MSVWKYSALDCILVLLSAIQFTLMITLAFYWDSFTLIEKLISFFSMIFMMSYNIIVISHFFTHTPWFKSEKLNILFSMVNSINIGQSVKIYHIFHVRNHHRYNNDQKNAQGETQDLSSTFSKGKNDEHVNVFKYIFVGSFNSLKNALKELASIHRFFKVSSQETKLQSLLSKNNANRTEEKKQIRLDRMALFFGIFIFLIISWKWTLYCYLPAYYLSLTLVNLQNYYEHFGANPESKIANSVSYYGKFYNLIAFNDGYHQEHHLSPTTHWSMLPKVKKTYEKNFLAELRIVSSVPAIMGFLDKKRPRLHKIINTKT